jgi:glycosyltransferase involved in cell wall biosynthesis
MRVLLSAFSCGPNYGSEPGVGWNWAVEIARMGHEVMTLTSTMWQTEIERELATSMLPPGLKFDFFMPKWLERARAFGWRLGLLGPTEHVVHLVWQFLALKHVRRRFPGEAFDVVHHITYGGIRHPTFMGRLPYPLVLGPLGGGERAPHTLRRGLPWLAWVSELLRDAHTWMIRFDPITVGACARATIIYVKTKETKTALPEQFHPKIAVEMEIGVRPREVTLRHVRPIDRPLRLLYAGRFLAWKGMHLGLQAVAEVRRRNREVELSIGGCGPAEKVWRKLAHDLDLDESVAWLGWVPFERMSELYRAHDALLFPSLHDSSGNVVLEALSEGLPVVCLDVGGPGTLVDHSCGRVVPSDVGLERECVLGLADAIEQLCLSPKLTASLSDGARCRAKDYEWPRPVERIYRDLESRLQNQRS